MLPPPAPENSNVIGIDWVDANYSGNYLLTSTDQLGDYGPCSSGWDNYKIDVPLSFNDKISSAKSFYGCNLGDHWENTNWTGAVYHCYTPCNIIGVMNDKTSSIWWHYD
jgi:hypothetical protein